MERPLICGKAIRGRSAVTAGRSPGCPTPSRSTPPATSLCGLGVDGRRGVGVVGYARILDRASPSRRAGCGGRLSTAAAGFRPAQRGPGPRGRPGGRSGVAGRCASPHRCASYTAARSPANTSDPLGRGRRAGRDGAARTCGAGDPPVLATPAEQGPSPTPPELGRTGAVTRGALHAPLVPPGAIPGRRRASSGAPALPPRASQGRASRCGATRRFPPTPRPPGGLLPRRGGPGLRPACSGNGTAVAARAHGRCPGPA